MTKQMWGLPLSSHAVLTLSLIGASIEAQSNLIKTRWSQPPAAHLQAGSVITVEIENQSKITACVYGRFALRNELGEEITSKVSAVEVMAGKVASMSYKQPPLTPGFYDIQFDIAADEWQSKSPLTHTFGYRANAITSPLTRPLDMDAFWQGARNELDAIKPEYQVIRRASLDSDTHMVYEVIMRSLGAVRIHAWYEVPKGLKRDANIPAVLLLPGYAQAMRPTGRSEPVALLSLNPRGHGNSTEDEPGTPHDYWIRGLEDEHRYYYRGAYMDCLRAVDFLVSRAEIDPARIMVTGGSQGGGLSLATAALDQRIALCAPDIAWLCDFDRYLRCNTETPDYDAWLAQKQGSSKQIALNTLRYFDNLNLADRIQCPVFACVGISDDVCPPATTYAVFARISSPKQMHAYPNVSHYVPAEHDAKKWSWMAKRFGLDLR